MGGKHGFACHGEHVKKGGVSGRTIHNLRACENHSNETIDPSLSHLNWIFREPENDTVYGETKKQIEKEVLAHGGRIRADSNWMEEFTFSIPNGMELGADREYIYLKTCHDEMTKLVGEKNVKLSVVHRDEGGQTHLHFCFTPITKDGRLSSKELITRSFLNRVHDDIPKALRAKGFEVVRGEPKSAGFKAQTVGGYKRDAEREKTRLKGQNNAVQKSILRQVKKLSKVNIELEDKQRLNKLLETVVKDQQETISALWHDVQVMDHHLEDAEQNLEKRTLALQDKEREIDRLHVGLTRLFNQFREKSNRLDALEEQMIKSTESLQELCERYGTRNEVLDRNLQNHRTTKEREYKDIDTIMAEAKQLKVERKKQQLRDMDKTINPKKKDDFTR